MTCPRRGAYCNNFQWRRTPIVPTSRLFRPGRWTARRVGEFLQLKSEQCESVAAGRDQRNVRSAGRDRRGVLVSVRVLDHEDVRCVWSLVRFALSARRIVPGLNPLDNVSSPTGQCASRRWIVPTSPAETPVPQGNPRRRRDNHEVGTIGVVPTSEQRRIRADNARPQGQGIARSPV
jgi:hypothetical protein